MSWVWLALVESEPAGGLLAAAGVHEQTGQAAGWLAAWPAGPQPVELAVRCDARLVDPAGPAAEVSLVLVPPELAPLFDDPAVSQAMRKVVLHSRPPVRAISTLTRDPVHFAGAITLVDGAGAYDDPFARLHPGRRLRVEAGFAGSAPPPPGPAIQRYGGQPWPAPGF